MTGPAPSRHRLCGAALVATVVIMRGVFLAGFIPTFHAPDEPAHFDYVQRLAETGSRTDPSCAVVYSAETHAAVRALLEPAFSPDTSLPPLDPVALATGGDRFTSGCGPARTYPPVYYATGAVVYRLAARSSVYQRVFAIRLVSVAWTTAGALFAYAGALLFFASEGTALLVALVYALQPMIGFIGAAVNPDAALFASATAAFASIAGIYRRGPSLSALSALATATLIGALSKTTFLYALPALFAFALAACGPRRFASWIQCALAVLPGAAAAVAWIIHSPQVVSGLRAEVKPLTVLQYLRLALAPSNLEMVWQRWYWVTWGWLDTHVAVAYHRALELGIALAAAGILLGWRGLRSQERVTVVLALGSTLVFTAALMFTELFVFRATGSAFIQGRYILPLFALHATTLAIGLRAFSARIRSAVHSGWVFVAVLALVNVGAVLRALGRYYA